MRLTITPIGQGSLFPTTVGPRSTYELAEMRNAVTAVVLVDADRIGMHRQPPAGLQPLRDFITISPTAHGSPVVLLELPPHWPERTAAILDTLARALSDDLAGTFELSCTPLDADRWTVVRAVYIDSEGARSDERTPPAVPA